MKKPSLVPALVRSITLAAVAAVALPVQAEVSVTDAWVRATVPQQKATSAFMRLSAPADSRLVSVTTPLTPVAEVHEMKMVDGVMRMRRVPALALPAGGTVELTPGGYHVMLMDLKQQVKAGDTVPLTLVFEDQAGRRETRQVTAAVRALAATAASAAPAAGTHDAHGAQGAQGGHKH
ncbi:copper chaperone PCu(A)C [Comamonadaceae bacterium OTU4NAUVB1]|nr:copper chaperone PCu(A)C [Comamonadaceae bacterium OTU4NAUVB1]